MSFVPFEQFHKDHARIVRRSYERSGADRWQIAEAEFAVVVYESAAARFASSAASHRDVERYLESLRYEDLALAAACERGHEPAWMDLLERFRSALLAAARALAGDETRARDLADELYADLYGLEQRDGKRKSLFRYFHGRSSLATWLRSVLARQHVDQIRDGRRSQAGRERLDAEMRIEASEAPLADPDRGRHLALLRRALSEALAALDPRDRLRLSYYHVQELTLAQVGRLLGEHESTVSRRLGETRERLRRSVEKALREEHRLTAEQIHVCLETALEVWPFDSPPEARHE
jgi:RNA polymerase sigma-70 factor